MGENKGVAIWANDDVYRFPEAKDVAAWEGFLIVKNKNDLAIAGFLSTKVDRWEVYHE